MAPHPQQQPLVEPQPTMMEPLSPREVEVMLLYSTPYIDKREICGALKIEMCTLNTYIVRAFSKLGETERFAAAWRFWELYPNALDLVRENVRTMRSAA